MGASAEAANAPPAAPVATPAPPAASAAPAPATPASAVAGAMGAVAKGSAWLGDNIDPIVADALKIPTIEREAKRIATQQFGEMVKFSEGVMHVKSGAWSVGLDLAEKLGLVDQGTADTFSRMDTEGRRVFDAAFKAQFGGGFGFAVAELGGEVLPFMAFPPWAIPKAFASGVARVAAGFGMGAAEGAAMGALNPVEGDTIDERMSQRGMGAALGAAVGGPVRAVGEGATLLKNWFPNALKRAITRNGKYAARGIELQDQVGFEASLVQLIDDPELLKFRNAKRAADPAFEVAERAREDAQALAVKTYFEKLVPPGSEDLPDHVAKMYAQVLGDDATGLIGARKLNAGRNFAAADEAGATVYLSNTLSTIDDIIARHSGVGASPASLSLAKQMEGLKVSIAEAGGGVISPRELQYRLEEWGRAAKGTGAVFKDMDTAAQRRPAAQMFSALNDDLDEAINAGTKGAAELRRARDQYRMDSVPIRQLQRSALGKLFKGIDEDVPSPEAIGAALLKMKPSQIKQTVEILGSVDPGLRTGLQNYFLSRALEHAKQPGPLGAVNFVPAKMLDLRKGNLGGATGAGGLSSYSADEVFNAVFPDSQHRQMVLDGMEAVRYIMVNNDRTGGRALPRLRNLAYSLANMNRGAAAAFAMDWLSAKAIPSYVNDPKSIAALQELSKPLDSTKAIAALTVLSNRWLQVNPDANEEAAAAEQMGQIAAPGM